MELTIAQEWELKYNIENLVRSYNEGDEAVDNIDKVAVAILALIKEY